jgi:3-oxoadipate enol-lactonase
MPIIDAEGCPLYVEIEGCQQGPVLMLSNSLGTTLAMWDRQATDFGQHFRLIRYDRRGHGKSGVPEGPYNLQRLGQDVLTILDALSVDKVNFCGLSLGGMVGMWLATYRPERINKLVLSNTACYMPGGGIWDERIRVALTGGMPALIDGILERWFTPEFRARAPQTMARMRDMVLSTPAKGYAACCAAIRDMDQRQSIYRISAPTLIIAGRHDPATPVEAGEFMRSRIPDAGLSILDAAHLSNIEKADDYTDRVLGFLLPPHS